MSNIIPQKTLINPKLLTILFMGFASGLPLALTGSTLQAWFSQSHIDLMTIGSLSLLGLPYTLKFLWAPLLDQYKFLNLAKRKGWILLAQIALVIMVFCIAQMSPHSQAMQMGMVAFLIAFFSATQDVAIDAYRTDILRPEERGVGVAYTIFSYRIAALISGGLALIFADHFGWKYTYEFIAVLLLLCIFPTCRAQNPEEFSHHSSNIFSTVTNSIRDLLQRDKIFLLLLFIIFY